VAVTYLVFLKTILEDVLDDQATGLTQGDLVPHTTEGFVDVPHDLGRRVTPAQLKELLPDVAGIAVDDSLGDTSEELVDHRRLVFLGDTIEGLLNDVAAERVHTQGECITANRTSNCNHLLRCAVLKAALNQEVSEAVDHQRIGLRDDRLDDVILLLWRADLQLLLQEDRRLLIVVTDDLVDDILPVAAHVTVQQTTVVHRLDRRHVLGASTRLGRRLVGMSVVDG